MRRSTIHSTFEFRYRFHEIDKRDKATEHCGLRGGETGTKMPYDDFSFKLKYMT